MAGWRVSWRRGGEVGPDAFAELARVPPSVGDWEDLLLRLEIVPRVVRNTVADVAGGAPAIPPLREAVAREVEVGRWLEVAAGIAEPGHGATHPAQLDADGADADALSLRFASLRARTFAMVQRRGLEVWGWEAPFAGAAGRELTVYQLLGWLARRDGDLLAALRGAVAGRAVC